MYKEQLTVKSYAQGLVTLFPWQAKFFHASANQWTKSEYATDRSIKTCPVEFRPEECSMSVWSGGWFIHRDGKLDLSIVECDHLGYLTGLEISKIPKEKYSTRREQVSSLEDMVRAVDRKVYSSSSSSLGRIVLGEASSISEINKDIEILRDSFDSLVAMFHGRDDVFALRVSSVVSRSLRWELVPD